MLYYIYTHYKTTEIAPHCSGFPTTRLQNRSTPAGGWTDVVLNPIRQLVRGRQRVQDLGLMLN